MKEYLRIRERSGRNATAAGIVITVLLHAGALCFISFSGLKYIWPPPQEQTFLVDFTEEEIPEPERRGRQPRSENPDREKPIEIVQKSQSPIEGKTANLTPETKPNDFGDVAQATPEPKEPVLDPRASFPGMAKKDTTLTAPHTADKSSESFKAGQADGNARKARPDGAPNAHLQGRSAIGSLPRPVYNVQESGTVVVTIWVDQYGSVKKAIAGAEGTTVTDKNLWAAARKAAMESHFKMDANAPALQEGTITYIFNLK